MSEKSKTTALLFAVAIVSFQSYALVHLTQKLADAEIGLGATPLEVNLTDTGGAPDMVGGC